MPRLSTSQRLSLERRTASYHQQLFEPGGADALSYLVEERGLQPETIRRFRLGVVADPGESDEPATGRISIPFTTPTGVVSLRFRQVPGDDHGAKYWQPKGSDIGIFNTPAIAAGGRFLVICEGEFDAMIACQLGLPAVGYPGAGSWKPYHREVYEGFERVLVIGDNDETWKYDDKNERLQTAAEKFCQKVADNVPDPTITLCPRGHDLSSFHAAEGPQAVLEHFKITEFQ